MVTNDMKKEFRAIIQGRVQLVMYRDFAVRTGRRLDIAGTARNLPDGTVEIIAQGKPEELTTYVEKLRRGPWLANVESIDVVWREPAEAIKDFSILY